MQPTAATLGKPTAVTVARSARAQPNGLFILDRYRLHRPLGTGGFGTVWMARDERLERDVAVKVLARERIVDGRFEREARAAARLSHPGIVTLYEAAVDDDGAYLVSELVRGNTLSGLLAAGRLSDRDILEIGVALSDALAHAHAQGVVHRDVKPSNVLIPEYPGSPGQVAKLTDFGVARLIGADALTRTGDVVGTAAYMAPEQAEGGEAGAAADLYALALVLYEALTGVNPIAQGGPAQRARRLGAHLPPLRRHRRDLPRELGAALDLALRPRPRDRGSLEALRSAVASSLHLVDDAPGVVEAPWPSRRESEPGHKSVLTGRFRDRAPGEVPAEQPAKAAPLRWPKRALAGVAAGLIAAWLLTLMPSPPSGAPAAAGLIAAVTIAALPRMGWIALIGTVSALLASRGRPGAAVLVGLAGLVPVVLLPRHRTSWPLSAAAALGIVNLAGAWPALAGRARTTGERIGLGAVGWIWTVAAGVLADTSLYTRPMTSAAGSVEHVLPRVLTPGLLAPAVIWGAGAALVPWISRRSLPLQAVLASAWSASLASGTVTLLHAWHGGTRPASAAVGLGALGAWIAVLAPALIERWAVGSRSTDTAAGLA